ASTDGAMQTPTLTSSGLSGLAPHDIKFQTAYTVLKSLHINAGSGGSTLIVDSAPALKAGGNAVTYNGGARVDTAYVQQTTQQFVFNAGPSDAAYLYAAATGQHMFSAAPNQSTLNGPTFTDTVNGGAVVVGVAQGSGIYTATLKGQASGVNLFAGGVAAG